MEKNEGIAGARLAAILVLAAMGVAPAAAQEEVDALERGLTEAWVRGDADAIAASREAAGTFVAARPDSARAHYVLGLAGLIGVIRPNGAPDSTDAERTLGVLEEAERHFARAHELDPAAADACAAYAFSILQHFMLGKASPELGPAMGEWIEKGRAAGPDQASVRLVSLWLSTGRTMTDPAQIDDAMEKFIDLAVSLRESAREHDRAPGFWELFGQGMAARALIFSPRPRPGVAAELVDDLLEASPGLHMAQAFLLPFVTVREPLAPSAWRELDWRELGGEAEPDGRAPGLPDAVAVAVYRDDEAGLLWIRVQLADPPDEKLFGINLVVDSDGSAETGSSWWGGNTDFVFDRLVSAWVARDGDGRYRGAVGITDDVGAYKGEMTNLDGEAVSFGIDLEGEALVLRVPLTALGASSARFLVAVGSNSQWNDDVPDEEAFTLER